MLRERKATMNDYSRNTPPAREEDDLLLYRISLLGLRSAAITKQEG